MVGKKLEKPAQESTHISDLISECMGQREDKFGSEGEKRRRADVWWLLFLQDDICAVFKYIESMLISMRETVMGKTGSNEVET